MAIKEIQTLNISVVAAGLATLLIVSGCTDTDEARTLTYVPIMEGELPSESFMNPPVASFEKSDYLFRFDQLTSFYDFPGEAGYFMPGADYGFDSLTIIVTETHPRGGPPLHTHAVEEAHILLSGQMDYIIGDNEFSAVAPYIAKVPAGAPHTFINSGKHPLNLIGVLSTSTPDYNEIGPNPLVE